MPCAPEGGGPGHSARRQTSRRAAEARRPARDHREGPGRVVGHVGGTGSRPDDYAALSASVTREGMAPTFVLGTPASRNIIRGILISAARQLGFRQQAFLVA